MKYFLQSITLSIILALSLTACTQNTKKPTVTAKPSAKVTPTAEVTPAPSPTQTSLRKEFPKLGLSLEVNNDIDTYQDSRFLPTEIQYHFTKGKYTLSITKSPRYTGGGVGLMFDGLKSKVSQEEIQIGTVSAIKKTFVLEGTNAQQAIKTMSLDQTKIENKNNIYGGTAYFTKKSNNILSPGVELLTKDNKKVLYGITYNSKAIAESKGGQTEEEKWFNDSTTTHHKLIIAEFDAIVKSIQFI